MGKPSDKAELSFNAGEFSPLLDSRLDLEKSASACRVLENFLIQHYGEATRRSGTRFIADATEPPDLS